MFLYLADIDGKGAITGTWIAAGAVPLHHKDTIRLARYPLPVLIPRIW